MNAYLDRAISLGNLQPTILDGLHECGVLVQPDETQPLIPGAIAQYVDGSDVESADLAFILIAAADNTGNVQHREQVGTDALLFSQPFMIGPNLPEGIADCGLPFEREDLLQRGPNPFQSMTTIRYFIPNGAAGLPAMLAVHDLGGRRIRILVAGRPPAGAHFVVWDGRDNGGGMVASGVYFLRYRVGDGVAVRPCYLIR